MEINNKTLWLLVFHSLLLCLPEPAESFAKITSVIEMRREDPESAVFTVVTPVILPVNLLTWSRAWQIDQQKSTNRLINLTVNHFRIWNNEKKKKKD